MAESLQTTKRRIKGTQNIGQITKAMELVAATRMRKSQEVALNSRPYSFTALDLLANIAVLPGVTLPELLAARPVKHTLVVVIASDKGLAGSFNSSVFRVVEDFLNKEQIRRSDLRNSGSEVRPPNFSFISVGTKTTKFLERKGVALIKSFVKVGDMTELDEVTPLADFVVRGYEEKKWDKVIVFSTHFRTALKQEVLRRNILPVVPADLKAAVRDIVPEHGRFSNLHKELEEFMTPAELAPEYIFEPTPSELLKELIPHLVLMQFYFLVLEANASEHAARRMAMESASSNAEELVNELTKSFNKSRQAAITREIIEVTAGSL